MLPACKPQALSPRRLGLSLCRGCLGAVLVVAPSNSGIIYDRRPKSRSPPPRPMDRRRSQTASRSAVQRSSVPGTDGPSAEFRSQPVQLSRLLSIKTGGCPEDCGYCSQSAHHRHRPEGLETMEVERVIAEAQNRPRRRRHPLLHGRRLAQSQRPRHGCGGRHGRRRQGARHGDLHDARHARPRIKRSSSRKPASTTTITISIPPSATTARSSQRAPLPTAWKRSLMSATAASRCAAAASSAWAKRRSTASICW